jgi:hypothetical protein
MLLIKPAPGVKVRMPEPPNDFLPDEPTSVAESPYWWRRLVKGDVILCDPKPNPTATKKAKE